MKSTLLSYSLPRPFTLWTANTGCNELILVPGTTASVMPCGSWVTDLNSVRRRIYCADCVAVIKGLIHPKPCSLEFKNNEETPKMTRLLTMDEVVDGPPKWRSCSDTPEPRGDDGAHAVVIRFPESFEDFGNCTNLRAARELSNAQWLSLRSK